MGRTVEIGSGLAADDRVIESPLDGITSGDEVHIANTPATGSAPETVAKDQRPRG
jgi:membrane fusion protein (multidrug efflux system)